MNENKNVSKKIKINIRSLISDYENAYPNVSKKGCALSADFGDAVCGEDADEVIEFATEGILTEKGNTIEITYRENKDLGMENIESTLRFKKNKPTLINLIRRGSAPASLLFDTEISRRNCTYCLGNLPFSFCICTNGIENIFSDVKGRIVLDYDIEMNGIKTEHNVFTLEYKK